MNYEKEYLRLLIDSKDLEAEIENLKVGRQILKETLDQRGELLVTLLDENDRLKRIIHGMYA